ARSRAAATRRRGLDGEGVRRATIMQLPKVSPCEVSHVLPIRPPSTKAPKERGRSMPLDPYGPNSGIRLPPWVSNGEAPFWPRMKDSRFREPVVGQPLDPLPGRPVFLAPLPERAPPEIGEVG